MQYNITNIIVFLFIPHNLTTRHTFNRQKHVANSFVTNKWCSCYVFVSISMLALIYISLSCLSQTNSSHHQ